MQAVLLREQHTDSVLPHCSVAVSWELVYDDVIYPEVVK